MTYINHLSIGFLLENHKNRSAVSCINSKKFEDYYTRMDEKPFTIAQIPAGYEHRPDLISDLFYGSPSFDWYICYFNNITDVFNELNVGDRILIPSL